MNTKRICISILLSGVLQSVFLTCKGGRRMRLINVDDIKWQKGVFVNPMTDEPIPVIHKIATIEMLRDW